MKILYKNKIYTTAELKKILTIKEWNQFVKKYNKFQNGLGDYVRTDKKFQGITIK